MKKKQQISVILDFMHVKIPWMYFITIHHQNHDIVKWIWMLIIRHLMIVSELGKK